MSPLCCWMGLRTGGGWGGDGSSSISWRGGHGTGILITGLSWLQVISSKFTPNQGLEAVVGAVWLGACRLGVRVPCLCLVTSSCPMGRAAPRTRWFEAPSTQWVLPARFITHPLSLFSPPGAPSSHFFPLGASNHMEMPPERAPWPDASVMSAEPWW